LTDKLREFAQRLGYEFGDPSLLARALTHRSRGQRNYERLEFLGDSILSFLIADSLYDRFPDLAEGDLTRLRATLVRRETLAMLARQLRLGDFLELGSGELKSGGFDRDSILADALEAVLGAVYKDGGMEAGSKVVSELYMQVFDSIDPLAITKDPKTRLQECLQGRSLPTPSYEVVSISGEPHQQHFVVQCRVSGIQDPISGEGPSRRNAEQAAAARACELLQCNGDA